MLVVRSRIELESNLQERLILSIELADPVRYQPDRRVPSRLMRMQRQHFFSFLANIQHKKISVHYSRSRRTPKLILTFLNVEIFIMYYLLGEITFFNQNRSLENKQILFYCRADWLYLQRRRSGLRQVIKTGKMPTRK